MVVIDTSVLIDHIRQKSPVDSVLIKLSENFDKQDLCISVISIQELYTGKSTLIKDREKELLAVISPLKILPYSYAVSKKAAGMMRDSLTKIEFADAAIAATCIINHAKLCTSDKNFKNIKDLEILEF